MWPTPESDVFLICKSGQLLIPIILGLQIVIFSCHLPAQKKTDSLFQIIQILFLNKKIITLYHRLKTFIWEERESVLKVLIFLLRENPWRRHQRSTVRVEHWYSILIYCSEQKPKCVCFVDIIVKGFCIPLFSCTLL